MTDKQFNITKRRVKSILEEWATGRNPRMVPLKQWQIYPEYSRGAGETDDGGEAAAQVVSSWHYKRAQIVFYLPALEPMADLEIEQSVVHELCHILVNEMREWGNYENETGKFAEARHEERVVTDLAMAFLGAKYRDLSLTEVTKKKD